MRTPGSILYCTICDAVGAEGGRTLLSYLRWKIFARKTPKNIVKITEVGMKLDYFIAGEGKRLSGIIMLDVIYAE